MKKIIFLIFLFFALAKISAQNYKINFIGSGSSNVVDSVKIENITQCTSKSINGNDTLWLLGSVGIEKYNSNLNRVNIYPNPSETDYFIEFELEKKANVKISIYGINGILIFEKQQLLAIGKHSYKLNSLSSGTYVININTGSNNYSTKLVCNSKTKFDSANLNNIDSESSLQLLESKFYNPVIQLNETKKSYTMQYTTGDRLKITGYSNGVYATIIVIVPNQSQTIAFDFIPCTDADGNNYSIVKIGSQIWMAENLKTTKYRNGNSIPNVTNNTTWHSLTTGAYCNYDNDTLNNQIYGSLYNWHAINDSNKIAPSGWHIPTYTEWQTLSNYFGGNNISGGKLKANCTQLWNNPNTNATNESGFTGFAGGFRDANAVFMEKGTWGAWWYSTSMNQTTAYCIILWHNDDDFGQHYAAKVNGFSVRCIKD